MKILITGTTGFVGSHLAEYIHDNHSGVEIVGTIRKRSLKDNIKHLDYVRFVECDLTDFHAVNRMIAKETPDRIFHLAAQSDVATSFKMPEQTLINNIQCELNLLEAVRNVRERFISLGCDPLIQIAGSSEEYGMVYQDELPISEDNPLRPLAPYAVSKVAQDLLARQYYYSYGIKCIVTRAFNHTGPRRGENFAESSWAKAIVRGSVVKHGNLESYRDYTDVRDMVRAYWLALEKGKSGQVYNICSGKAHKMQNILEMLIKLSGKKDVKTEIDESRMRPSDVPVLQGDSTKFRTITGWKPRISIKQTLIDLLDHWR